MTEPNPFIDENDQDIDVTESDGSKLRKWGKAEKKRADDLAKELAELRAELDKRKASDVFAELGVPEKIRKFYLGEFTKEAVSAWVDENADVFGIDRTANEPTPEQKQQVSDLEAVQQAALTGLDRNTALSRESMQQFRQDLLSNKTSSVASLDEVLAKMQVPNLPIQGPMM